jgi:hypothetical protein
MRNIVFLCALLLGSLVSVRAVAGQGYVTANIGVPFVAGAGLEGELARRIRFGLHAEGIPDLSLKNFLGVGAVLNAVRSDDGRVYFGGRLGWGYCSGGFGSTATECKNEKSRTAVALVAGVDMALSRTGRSRLGVEFGNWWDHDSEAADDFDRRSFAPRLEISSR